MQINLIQIIRLLVIDDSEIITFSTRHGDPLAPFFSVAEIRKRFDMKRICPKRVYTHGSVYTEDINWEFIVDKKTFDEAVFIRNRELERRLKRHTPSRPSQW